jgi:hypothetical protein
MRDYLAAVLFWITVGMFFTLLYQWIIDLIKATFW